MKQVTVVVLNRNGRHYLQECLDSLRDQTFREFETILVDNGSTDGSIELATRRFPEIEVIALPTNVGFAQGNNVGIRVSAGQYVALLNNDTRADPGWLLALKTTLDSHGEVGSCASKILFYDRPEFINSAGDVFYSYGVAGQRGCLQGDGGSFSQLEYVFGACAGAVMYRRTMLEDIGLFDEDFFACDEDVDLSFRAQLMGYRCLFVPNAVVYHHHRGTLRHQGDTAFHLSRRNSLYVIVKNLPADLLLRNSVVTLLYYLGGDIWHILNGRGISVLKSRLDNLRSLPRMLQRRRTIQRRKRVSSEYLGSLFASRGFWEGVRLGLSRRGNDGLLGMPLEEHAG